MLDSRVQDRALPEEQLQGLMEVARLADIGRLVGIVAHELGTPLASIALRAQSLGQQAKDPRLVALEPFARFPRYLKTIEEETFRCKEILSNLSDFARAGSAVPRAEDVGEIARRVAALLRHDALRRQVTVEVRAETDAPLVRGDTARLGQAVLALVRNALEASRPGNRVTVVVRRSPAGGCELVVTDQGHGVPPELAERVFEPFFTTRGPGWAGLGLTLCQAIARSLGGEIRFESLPDRGSEFVLSLPGSRNGPATRGHEPA